MSETLAFLDLITENLKNIQKEIKIELDNKVFNSNVETLLIYLLGNINTISSEIDKARKEYSDSDKK